MSNLRISVLAFLVVAACGDGSSGAAPSDTQIQSTPPARATTSDSAAILGRWRRTDGGEIAEFLPDGTATRRIILAPGDGYTVGETYAFPAPGKLRLEQMGSPRTFDYTLQDDTLRLVNLEGQAVVYTRVPPRH